MSPKRGFTTILLAVLVLIVGGGAFYFYKNIDNNNKPFSKEVADMNAVPDKQKIGTLSNDETLVHLALSQDGMKSAYIIQRGFKNAGDLTAGRYFVIADGKESRGYEDVHDLIYSPDGRHVAYGALLKEEYVNTSPGVQKQVSSTEMVVLDGHEEKTYDSVSQLIFSPNNESFAYTASIGNKVFIVFNGAEEKYYDSVISSIFSTDGKHFAYIAKKNGSFVIVLDGMEVVTESQGSLDKLVFDSNNAFSYVTHRGNKSYITIDGQRGKDYDGVSGVIFSTDDKQKVYQATQNNKTFFVINGKETKPHDYILSFAFSEDGKLAYIAQDNDKLTLIQDNTENALRYDFANYLNFDPIGKLIYTASYNHESYLITDGHEDRVFVDGIFFSKNHKHMAYIVSKSKSDYMVVDSSRGNEYDSIVTLPFFSKNNDELFYGAQSGNDLWKVVEHIN